MILVWLKFIIAAAVVLVAGVQLSKYGDVLAEKTGLSGGWIGLIFLAFATSLPELVTCIGAVVIVKDPNLAIGDIFGSNAFNLTVLGLMGVFHGSGPAIFKKANPCHILSAKLGIVLTMIASIGILIPRTRLFFGLDSLLIFVGYLIGIRLLFRCDKRNIVVKQEIEIYNYKHISLKKTCFGLLLATIAIVGAGITLAQAGEDIAILTGWGTTFIGALFLAVATSFPEVVVSISAVRLGAVDMAFGNIFGSNLFNLAIIFLADLFYQPGPILSSCSSNNILIAFEVIILTIIAMLGFKYQPKRSFLKMGWCTVAMLTIYLVGTYTLFRIR